MPKSSSKSRSKSQSKSQSTSDSGSTAWSDMPSPEPTNIHGDKIIAHGTFTPKNKKFSFSFYVTSAKHVPVAVFFYFKDVKSTDLATKGDYFRKVLKRFLNQDEDNRMDVMIRKDKHDYAGDYKDNTYEYFMNEVVPNNKKFRLFDEEAKKYVHLPGKWTLVPVDYGVDIDGGRTRNRRSRRNSTRKHK